MLDEPTLTLPKARLVVLQRLTMDWTRPEMLNDALTVAPTVVTGSGPEPVALVGMLTAIAQLAPGAMAEQLFEVTAKIGMSPLSPLRVIAESPSLRKVTAVAGAAAPYQATPRSGAAPTNVATDPVTTKLTLVEAAVPALGVAVSVPEYVPRVIPLVTVTVPQVELPPHAPVGPATLAPAIAE